MPLSTIQSTGKPLQIKFDRVITAMQQARAISVTWKATLAAGNTPIQDIIDGIYVPFVQSTSRGGFWRTISDEGTGKQFRNYYRDQLSQRIAFEPGDENLTTDRITLGGNNFATGDPVQLAGPGTPPGGLTKGVNYWVFDKQGQGVSFATAATATKINLIAVPTGHNFVEMRVGADFTTLTTALEAVIDQIVADLPVATATTAEIQSLAFDKNLTFNPTGLKRSAMTATQTAEIQTDLQSVIDAIEAPV